MSPTSEMPDPNQLCLDSAIWYFGYGSNIRSASMTKREITPLQAQAVVVPSHILTFDIFGIPCAEPAFASIATYQDIGETQQHTQVPPVHGVAYLLTRDDYRRLVLSEGSGVGYDEIQAEAFPIANTDYTPGKGIMVHTLKAKYPFRPNRAPSVRYMSLLIEGATENGLPESYIQYLKSLPTFSAGQSTWAALGSSLFLGFFARAVRVLAYSTKLVVNEKGHCPRPLGTVIVWFYWGMWTWHDYVHARLWGRGDGGIIHYGGLRLS
ncbi:Gamma-glutamyl cyclotransferase gliK [Exophiala dermatitidis]